MRQIHSIMRRNLSTLRRNLLVMRLFPKFMRNLHISVTFLVKKYNPTCLYNIQKKLNQRAHLPLIQSKYYIYSPIIFHASSFPKPVSDENRII